MQQAEINEILANHEYVIRCSKIFEDVGIEPFIDIEGNIVRYSINMNDMFYWACADSEEITPENIHVLEESYRDLKALAETDPNARFMEVYTGTLFACRVRGQRPQGAAYPSNKEVWPLIDACGPERETDFFNPCEKGYGEAKMTVYRDMLLRLYRKAYQEEKEQEKGNTLIKTDFNDINGNLIEFNATYLPKGDISINDGEFILSSEDTAGELLKWLNYRIVSGGK